MRRVLALAIAAALAVVVALPAGAGPPDGQRNFRTHLTGSGEVPAVPTDAQGQAIFQLSKDGDSLQYKLIAANIDNVLQSHIHCGSPDVNGPVAVFLYPDGPPPVLIPGTFNGVLASGVITGIDFSIPDSAICPGGIADFDDLIAQMRAGNAYVNVHTVANMGGEIRGQIG